MTKKRDINMDFVRAMLVLFIVLSHFFDHTGLYEFDTYMPIKLIAIGIRMVLGSCVAMFMMLTGFFCSEKKLSARYYLGFLRIYEIYLICSAFTFLFRAFVQHEPTSLSYMVGAVVNFYSIEYAWYLLMYLGLFLMIPFLNLAFNGLENDRQRLVLIGTFLYLSILPSMLNVKVQLLSVWWKNLSPIAYYFTGAYLHKNRPKVSAKKTALVLLAAAVVFVGLDVLLLGPSGKWTIEVTRYDYYQGYICAVLFFIVLMNAGADRLPPWAQAVITRIAALSMPIYLLSNITDSLIYPWFKSAVPDLNRQILWWLPISLLSFTGATVLAQLADWICNPLDKLVRGFLLRHIPALRK